MSTSTENIPKASESGGRASDDLLEIVRATGLRQHMHGVNATAARLILQRFLGALRFLRADDEAPTASATLTQLRDAAAPLGFALVPLIPTRAMNDVFATEDWRWSDLLAEAEAIDEAQQAFVDEHEDAILTPPTIATVDVDDAADILQNLITNIEKDGLYSKEFILASLSQAYHALVPANSSPTSAADAELMGWRPIATAPKDGRTLLLGYYNRASKWRTVRGEWISEAEIAENWEDPDDAEPGWFETSVEADDTPNCWAINPTHWMPLPAAPNQHRTSAHFSGDPS